MPEELINLLVCQKIMGIKILNTIQQIPDKIEEKCNQSSKLAYKIHDKPEIKLDTSIQNYLDKISNVTLEQD